MRILNAVGELLFPRKCVLCGKLLEKEETDLCRHCRVEAPECAVYSTKFSFLDSWTAVWYYEDPVRGSVLRYKFSSARHYADCYGRMLAMRLLERFPEGFDCLTWVPISRLRKFRRGYDQVELLARAVGRELGMEPVRLLQKIRNNPPQSGISGQAERRANVLGVYRLKASADVENKRILLLDDVITTGATAGECARVLLTGGASEVHFGAVAAARHHGKTK
jgi:ComF family protein